MSNVTSSKSSLIDGFRFNRFESEPEKFLSVSDQKSQPKKSNRPSNAFWSKETRDEKLSIKEYFNTHPDRRVKQRRFLAKQICTAIGIVEILNYGNEKNIQDSYDGAIALLAECQEHLLSEVIILGRHPVRLGGNIELLSPQQWEILIKGVACSITISSYKKYFLIVGLLNNYDFWNRLVKTAIIDAFLILEDVDADLIQPALERFVSSKEQDAYIREYAKEALEDILC